jgi:hypothetical protein
MEKRSPGEAKTCKEGKVSKERKEVRVEEREEKAALNLL